MVACFINCPIVFLLHLSILLFRLPITFSLSHSTFSFLILTRPLVQFAGQWYVIEVSSTSSDCYTMGFSISDTSPGVYNVEDSKRLWYGNVVNSDIFVVKDYLYTITEDGKMTIQSQIGS